MFITLNHGDYALFIGNFLFSRLCEDVTAAADTGISNDGALIIFGMRHVAIADQNNQK